MNLYNKLKNYSNSDYYPFHMPGHKRNEAMSFQNPYSFDITEIDGFDNLHHSEDILLKAQERAAKLYQSSESYYLINGSTAGILSSILACTSREGTILMARNCHKSVYHGVFLNELENIYIYPQSTGEYCINGGLNPEDIKELLINHKNIQAVIITSPSYDGVVSNVKEIARIVHEFGIPLIVDEAHGAHFGFHPSFPIDSIENDADIVIHSLHKTLPSLTQTALLHVNGKLVDRDKLKRYLSIFQTSSPSYVLMASIDSCIELINDKKEELFTNYVNNLSSLRKELSTLANIKLVGENLIGTYHIFDYDRSKIILSTKNTDITGKELYNILLEKYHLQMEMAAGDYCLAMTSIMDKEVGYERLVEALHEIDNKISFNKKEESININIEAKVCYNIAKATNSIKKSCNLEDSNGKISAEFVYLYPPGIPLIVPGEEITNDLIQKIISYKGMGLNIEGMKDDTHKTIQVLV